MLIFILIIVFGKIKFYGNWIFTKKDAFLLQY